MIQTYDKSTFTNKKFNPARWEHKNATKMMITQRSRADQERSIWVITLWIVIYSFVYECVYEWDVFVIKCW